MICSLFFSSSTTVGSDLSLYIEVGWVYGDLGSLVYGLHVPESRRALLQRRWTLMLS
jgi:hypothetical protein